MLKIEQAWIDSIQALEKNMSAQKFNTWIKPLQIELQEDLLLLFVPNTFAEQFIRVNFLSLIESTLLNFYAKPLTISLQTRLQTEQKTKDNGIVSTLSATEMQENKAEQFKKSLNSQDNTRLNPNFTFDTLVTGRANQFAKAASIQVAENPSQDYYNPLFIYGASGLGKTHLMHAIGNFIHQQTPQAKVRYITAEKYVRDVVRAYQHGTFQQFQEYYNHLDVLLIDDIQFFTGKEKTLEEFFNLFNILKDGNKQIVVSCDTLPKEIQNMPDRLKNRLGNGLTVELEPPELEMRVAILRKKADHDNLRLDSDIALYIANNIRSNVRELEGALKKIIAYTRFNHEKLNLSSAKEALKDIISVQNRSTSIEQIQKIVTDFYKIKLSDLLSKKRSRDVARPRQIAMALARELTQLSLPSIGLAFDKRDHTTVLYACKLVEELREQDKKIKHEYNVLLQMLRD